MPVTESDASYLRSQHYTYNIGLVTDSSKLLGVNDEEGSLLVFSRGKIHIERRTYRRSSFVVESVVRIGHVVAAALEHRIEHKRMTGLCSRKEEVIALMASLFCKLGAAGEPRGHDALWNPTSPSRLMRALAR